MKLIIVESPTKARTISQFLGKDFVVESCNGHIRDLPSGRLGVDIANDFQPQYVIPTKKRRLVNQLKKIAARAKIIYFATDEDREGEAIAWHLAQIFNLNNRLQKPESNRVSRKNDSDHSDEFVVSDRTNRIVFHEITKEAIKEAIKNPREIDLYLVNAQQARRILDRLVGYGLSPLLWKKIAKRLSAGRVQSVALRLIVEREREREKFVPQEYYTISARLQKLKIINDKSQIPNEFEAELYKINEKKLDKFAIKNKKEAQKILKNLKDANYSVLDIEQKEVFKNPPPPFFTSTLQQEANRRFGFSVKKTMLIAQQLYEGIELGKKGSVGLITYMRTDSFNLAEKFLNETRKYLKENFSSDYLPTKPHYFKVKSKTAQEAHEAIRPTSIYRQPEKIKEFLTEDQFKIYDLIWRRTLASQMEPGKILTSTVRVLAQKELIENHCFKATGNQIKFDGWLKVYPTKIDELILPPLTKKEKLKLIELSPRQHFTEPAPRYSEAGLVKALEKYGIGRPSTYAPTISTLFERNYIQKENGRLVPTEIGFKVNDLLVEHFPKIVDYRFTAEMEEKLDETAKGQRDWQKMIKDFYWPFKEDLDRKEKEIVRQEPIEEKTNEKCPICGKALLIKISRFGKFLACSGFPECRYTKSLHNNQESIMKCPKCKEGDVIKKRTKRSRFFYGCSRWPDCDYASWKKPESNVT